MISHHRSALALAAVAGAAGLAHAVPSSGPTFTFCETECGDDGAPRGAVMAACNDTCADPQIIDASLAVGTAGDEQVRDCFYITGKLQADCVWGIEPKCQIRAYDKPLPCRDTNGVVIPGRFYEPLLRVTNAAGVIEDLPVLSDRTVRLAVGALQDGFDGTFNGLNNNGPHFERGELTVKLYYQGSDGQLRGDAEPDDEYVFDLTSGTDAARVAFIVPAGVASVDVVCCDDTGQVAVGWDVDHFLIRNLLPGRFYAIEVVGGERDPDALAGFVLQGGPTPAFESKLPALLGWFDKNCNLLNCAEAAPGEPFPRLFVTAEVDGTLRIAVSGAGSPFLPVGLSGESRGSTGDCNFNGIADGAEAELEEFLFRIRVLEDLEFVIFGSASLKDATAGLVNRFPREIWDEYFEWNGVYQEFPFYAPFPPLPLEFIVGHGVVGGYCIKITLAEHVDPSDRPVFPGTNVINAGRNDMNSDGQVDASDLALLLSYWGAVSR